MMASSEETWQESFFQVEIILRLPDHLLETPTIILLPPGAQDMEKSRQHDAAPETKKKKKQLLYLQHVVFLWHF